MADPFSKLGQLRLLDLPGAIQPSELGPPIDKNDVGFPDQTRSNVAMLKEVVNNRILAEAFEGSRGLILQWNLAEILLRAKIDPVKWKNSDQYRSHLGIPILAESYYSLVSVIQESLFSGFEYFKLDSVSGTSEDVVAAETALINAQFKRCGYRGTSLKQEIRELVQEALLYGTGVGFYGWESYRQEVKKMRRPATTNVTVSGGSLSIPQANPDDLEEYTDHVIEFNQVKLEHVRLRQLRVDPTCRRGDISTASWAARILYLDSYELDALRGQDGYTIPTRDELVALTTPYKQDYTGANVLDAQGSTTGNPTWQTAVTAQKAYPDSYDYSTSDPLGKKWEIYDYWTPYRHVVVLENQYVIYNEVSYNLGKVPFCSVVFRSAPDSFYGYSIAFFTAGYQQMAQGVVNCYFDDLNLKLLGSYQTDAGFNNTAQSLWVFPGKLQKTDPGKEIKPLLRDPVTIEPLAIVDWVKSAATQISGAGISAQGTNPGKPGDLRTPGAASAIINGEGVKTTDFVDQLSDRILVPMIEYIITQNHRLKPSQIRQWLSDELTKAYKTVDPIDLINGQYKVTVSAASRLRARTALNQLMGFVQTIVNAPQASQLLGQQGMKVDFAAFVEFLIDSTGLPIRENIIKPMTDQDQARFAASQNTTPPAEKMIALQTASKKEIDDNQSENRMILETGKHVLKANAADQQHGHTVEEDALNRAERSQFQKSDENFVGGGSTTGPNQQGSI